ncbi:MAG: LLM class F420-dependent oxidoreductase [Candidatus Dojkabacteria bacterium]
MELGSFFPLYGDADGKHFEGWTTLAAMGSITKNATIGCLVTCNSYRNPNLLADMARTLDHITHGRAILGIGAGWFEKDYQEYGYDFGASPGVRLKRLEEALPIIRERLSHLNPLPVQEKLPILIGGGGEKVTLRLVATYADMLNTFGPAENFRHKNEILNNWCKEVGRNPEEIERTVIVNDVNDLDGLVEAGAAHIIPGIDAPWNTEPVEKLLAWRDQRKSR